MYGDMAYPLQAWYQHQDSGAYNAHHHHSSSYEPSHPQFDNRGTAVQPHHLPPYGDAPYTTDCYAPSNGSNGFTFHTPYEIPATHASRSKKRKPRRTAREGIGQQEASAMPDFIMERSYLSNILVQLGYPQFPVAPYLSVLSDRSSWLKAARRIVTVNVPRAQALAQFEIAFDDYKQSCGKLKLRFLANKQAQKASAALSRDTFVQLCVDGCIAYVMAFLLAGTSYSLHCEPSEVSSVPGKHSKHKHSRKGAPDPNNIDFYVLRDNRNNTWDGTASWARQYCNCLSSLGAYQYSMEQNKCCCVWSPQRRSRSAPPTDWQRDSRLWIQEQHVFAMQRALAEVRNETEATIQATVEPKPQSSVESQTAVDLHHAVCQCEFTTDSRSVECSAVATTSDASVETAAVASVEVRCSEIQATTEVCSVETQGDAMIMEDAGVGTDAASTAEASSLARPSTASIQTQTDPVPIYAAFTNCWNITPSQIKLFTNLCLVVLIIICIISLCSYYSTIEALMEEGPSTPSLLMLLRCWFARGWKTTCLMNRLGLGLRKVVGRF